MISAPDLQCALPSSTLLCGFCSGVLTNAHMQRCHLLGSLCCSCSLPLQFEHSLLRTGLRSRNGG